MTDRYIRFDQAAKARGLEPTELLDHMLTASLHARIRVGDGVEYRAIVTDVTYANGSTNRVTLPPPIVPDGGSPIVPAGLFKLTQESVRQAVRNGAAVHALEDDDGDIYFLARPLELTREDLVLTSQEWKDLRATLPRRRGPSARDEERLALGADSMLTVRKAAELLPGSDGENRRMLKEAGVVRVIRKQDPTKKKSKGVQVVRWGDVVELFPTETRLKELEATGAGRLSEEPIRTRKPRGFGIHLADLD